MSPSMTNLSLSYCGLGKDSGRSIQLILAFIDSKLETLNIQGNALGKDGIKCFISGILDVLKAMKINQTITELNISDNKFSSDDAITTELCDIFKTTKSLKMLDMKYNEITEPHVQTMMEAITIEKKTKIDVTDRFSPKTSSELNALMKSIKTKKPKKKPSMKS